MEKILYTLLNKVVLPRVFRFEQHFANKHVAAVDAEIANRLQQSPAFQSIKPGMRIALSVGSRGIACLPELVAAIVAMVKSREAHPFIVPAMGSHGGATAKGQQAVLEALGVHEAGAGCPIYSSMETVEVGRLDCGMRVHMDRYAQQADGIIVFNRVKAHNAFRADNESGLVKMLAIGLGKQAGADECHRLGFGHVGHLILEMARVKLQACPVLMGIGVVENAYDNIHSIFVTCPEELVAKDAQALQVARGLMPSLACQDLDMLLVDRIGKEYSGGGMDGNITGRYGTPFISGGPRISTVVVLDVTKKTAGNANGIGQADITTQALLNHYDRASVYANCLTSRVVSAGRLPIAMPTERQALQAGIKVCCALDQSQARYMRIANTLDIAKGYAGEALLPELRAHPQVRICSEPAPMSFSAEGMLLDPWW